MKKIILCCFILLLSRTAFSQASGLYIIREKIILQIGSPNTSSDTLFVTNPSGITTKYSLPILTYYSDLAAHDQAFSQIINPIIQSGYKIIPMGDWNIDPNDYTGFTAYTILRTMFLGAPWTTASSELEPLKSFVSIFPNPASERLTIKWEKEDNFQPLEVVVINSSGYIVLRHQVESVFQETIQISSLAAGTYLVSVKDDCRYTTPQKFIKQ